MLEMLPAEELGQGKVGIGTRDPGAQGDWLGFAPCPGRAPPSPEARRDQSDHPGGPRQRPRGAKQEAVPHHLLLPFS